MLFYPSFVSRLHEGDTVIAVGDIGNLQRLEIELYPSAGGNRSFVP